MRVLFRTVLAVLVLSTPGLPQTTVTPPPGAAAPTSTVAQDTSVPSSPQDIQPAPQIAQPQPDVPAPVAPSEAPSGYAPSPRPPVTDLTDDQVHIDADHIRYDPEGNTSIAEGNVRTRYRNVEVASQKASVDYNTNVAVFEGGVLFRTDGQEATAEEVTLNLRTREWSGLSAFSTITPQFTRGWLRAPLFTQSAKLQGLGQKEIDLTSSRTTTCNLSHPHYEFTARSITIYPDSKIIFRKVTVIVLGHTLYTLPRFVVPLRQIEREPRVVPQIGQSANEGFFLKAAYPYLGTKAQTGILLLDLMSEKGIGKGIRHAFKTGSGSGEANVYQIFDRTIDENTFTGRLNLNQRAGTVNMNLSTDFRDNSYLYAPNSTTINSRLALNRTRTGASTSLVLNQSISDTYTRSNRLTGNLTHRQAFGDTASLNTSFDYIDFSQGSQSSARLTSQALYNQSEKAFDWHISAQKLTDLTDEAFVGQGGFAGIEKLPEVGIATDTKRLGRTLLGIPAQMRLTYGQYTELPNSEDLGRTLFEFATPVSTYGIGNTWKLRAGAGFKQYAYSDDTAQYSLDTSADLAKTLGPTSTFRFTYRFQRPRGFTPFRFDFVGRYNILNASLDLKDNKRFRISLLTGYNFEQKDFPWQDATLRVSFEPNKSLLLYTATGYDFNRAQWRAVINQLRIRAGEAFKLDLGTRYDPTTSTLATARINVDTRLSDKWRLQGLAGYNGVSREFDYRQFMLTRDLHCWEASLIYMDQSGFFRNQSIMLNFRIKAFPFYQGFGVGAFGQALDTSVGQVY